MDTVPVVVTESESVGPGTGEYEREFMRAEEVKANCTPPPITLSNQTVTPSVTKIVKLLLFR